MEVSTLYRKYRPHTFDDVVGQDHIKSVLRVAVDSKSPSHAYLFAGPRGVGKTSVARIFAKLINNLDPTDETTNYVDIIEIDAASNRRIDEIREIRDKVSIAPSQLKYKVYIIDEVHMLTKEAFNALLKTLEEPPSHVVFILATTELHMLPETIISRTQKHNFKLLDNVNLSKHIKMIADKEGFSVSDEAVESLIKSSRGGGRDALSQLGQVLTSSSTKDITARHVETILGLAASVDIKGLITAYMGKDTSKGIEILKNNLESGIKADSIAIQTVEMIKQIILSGKSNKGITSLATELVDVHSKPDPEMAILTIFTFVDDQNQAGPDKETQSPDTTPEPVVPPASAKLAKNTSTAIETKPIPSTVANEVDAIKTIDSEEGSQQKSIINSKDSAGWEKILSEVKDLNSSYYTLLRMVAPITDGDTLRLTARFAIHKKKLEDKSTLSQILTIVKKYSEISAIEIVLSSPDEPAALESTPANVIDFMGGGEVIKT